jgi:predicted GIY-YIG superfamily endonuclease
MRAIPSSLFRPLSLKPTKSRSFLLGYTPDLKRRLIEHNSGKSIFTKNFFLRKLKITSPLKTNSMTQGELWDIKQLILL